MIYLYFAAISDGSSLFSFSFIEYLETKTQITWIVHYFNFLKLSISHNSCCESVPAAKTTLFDLKIKFPFLLVQ